MYSVITKTSSFIRGAALKPIQNLVKMSTSTIPKYETLAVTAPKEHVIHVELNRPDSFNAFNHTMWEEIKTCFEHLNSSEDCRVIILSGAGKHFTAGLDLKSSMSIASELANYEDVARKAKVWRTYINKYQQSISSIELCQKPVLAAVHSACVGAGVDMITAADMRYCTKDSWYQVKETDIGMAADVGTLQRLPKVIGSSSLVRELCYTARKLSSSEALSSGLVSTVFENKESMLNGVLGIAEEIAKKSPVAVQVTKLTLNYSRDHPVKDSLEYIALWNQMVLQSEDFSNATVGQLTKDPNIVFAKL